MSQSTYIDEKAVGEHHETFVPRIEAVYFEARRHSTGSARRLKD